MPRCTALGKTRILEFAMIVASLSPQSGSRWIPRNASAYRARAFGKKPDQLDRFITASLRSAQEPRKTRNQTIDVNDPSK